MGQQSERVAGLEQPNDLGVARERLDLGVVLETVDARPDLVTWLSTRIERSHIIVQRVVDALDQEVLESRKRLSIPLARTVLTAAGIVTQPQPLLPMT